MFDLVAGFCHSQILCAFTSLGLPELLLDGPRTVDDLARAAQAPPARLLVLVRGAAALGLVRERRGRFALTTRGAALAAVPGLGEMIAHHAILYRDLADPVAFFRGETETELAAFWPYVLGAGGEADPARAERYSRLMAESQSLVIEDTLAAVDLRGVRRLMDVGGGTGAFLLEAARAYPRLEAVLYDLPAVAAAAEERFAGTGLAHRLRVATGSFREDALPRGADAISLVRVLYDHDDASVRALLAAVFAALPPGGLLVVSEPMAGSRAGDAYFALYCMAMRTGRVRSAREIAGLMREAGFARIRGPSGTRPFVTSVLQGVRKS